MKLQSIAGVVVACTAVISCAQAQAANRPDLRVGAFAAPAAEVAPGATLTLRIATRNTGARRSAATRTVLLLSRDARRTKDDRRLAAVKVRALRARRVARNRVRVTVPADVAAGAYRVLSCADSRRKVRERNERNNCRTARGLLSVLPGAGGVVGGSSGDAAPAPPAPPAPGPADAGPADTDGDGVGDAQDCAPNDAAVSPAALDRPDLPAFIDSNCDGIDGNAARSVFVSPGGDDASPGTREQPKRTLTAAIAAAAPLDFDVLAADGEYPEQVVIADGVGIYGGYDTAWTRSLERLIHVVSPSRIGARATGIVEPTDLQLVHIRAADAAAGTSSYGLLALQSPGLVLDGVRALAGHGSSGLRGDDGRNGEAGVKGTDGADGGCDTGIEYEDDGNSVKGPGAGGGGGGSAVPGRAGGKGGDGGYGVRSSGTGGRKGGGEKGGAGGAGGRSGDPGAPGARGADGALGTNGASGAGGGGGSLDPASGEWLGRAGNPGAMGGAGHGGGGGGGGGGNECFFCVYGVGNGGGGGGGGGMGGAGGSGGTAGGGSFGMAFVDSGGAVVRNSIAQAADGGSGGAGGSGGYGGVGGAWGDGGDACPSEIGRGGHGGIGGFGGYGGAGGGGAGGPSIGLITDGPAPVVESTTLGHAAGGKGGGSVGLNKGQPGRAAPRWP